MRECCNDECIGLFGVYLIHSLEPRGTRGGGQRLTGPPLLFTQRETLRCFTRARCALVFFLMYASCKFLFQLDDCMR